MDLKRAVALIDSGTWISIRFITADVNKGTGGKVIEIDKCKLYRAPGQKAGAKRPQAHSFNFTRNMLLPNRQIRKIHPVLVTHVNQEAVI